MSTLNKLTFWFLLSTVNANSNEITAQRRSKDKTETDVVNLAFCESSLTPEDRLVKQTLEEVHTFAELRHDPRASLQDSFTVCSSILTTGCGSDRWSSFFTILDNNKTQLLAPMYKHGSIESLFILTFSQRSSGMVIGKISSLFPTNGSKAAWL